MIQKSLKLLWDLDQLLQMVLSDVVEAPLVSCVEETSLVDLSGDPLEITQSDFRHKGLFHDFLA